MRKELGIGEDVKVVILNFGGQVSLWISLTRSSEKYMDSNINLSRNFGCRLNLVASFVSLFSLTIFQDCLSSCSCLLFLNQCLIKF